jgi:hypothetical protein
MQTYKFYTGDVVMLRVKADEVAHAFEAANVFAREEGHVQMGESFAWFPRCNEPQSFYLGHNVFLD